MNARAKAAWGAAGLVAVGLLVAMVVYIFASSTKPNRAEPGDGAGESADQTPAGEDKNSAGAPAQAQRLPAAKAMETASTGQPSGLASRAVRKVVYANPFTSEPGDEWSDATIARTPLGNRPYLGDFTTDPVTLSLSDLPEHKLLRITFDLFLMKSWDGSGLYWGRCFWDLSIPHGPNLIHTTFGNDGFFQNNNEQAFPDTYPCGPHPDWTGSAEHQTLGTIQSWGPSQTYDTSSVYHMALVFPHSESQVAFCFVGTPMRNRDKRWGLANLRVEAIPDFTPLSETQLGDLWNKLASEDPSVAFKASWELAAAGDVATAYLGRQLAGQLDDKIVWSKQDLDLLPHDIYSEDAAKVDAAIAALEAQGPNGFTAMQKAVRDPKLPSPVRLKLSHAMNRVVNSPRESPADLRLHRARHLLQVIHSEESMALVNQIRTHPGDDGNYEPPVRADKN